MALYVKIPKDLNGIKDKVIFNLTKRQLVCFGLGLAIGLSSYWLTYKTIGTSAAAVLLFCLGSPFFLTGMYTKYGVFTLEKIVANYIRHIICPKMRPYRTDNVYRQIISGCEYKKEVKMLATGTKQIKN